MVWDIATSSTSNSKVSVFNLILKVLRDFGIFIKIFIEKHIACFISTYTIKYT